MTIAGSYEFVFALTVKGELRYLEADLPQWRRSDVSPCFILLEGNTPEWKTVFEDYKIQDIASCSGNVAVIELANNTRFALSYCRKWNPNSPPFPIITLPSGASLDELFAKCAGKSFRTISAEIEPPPPAPRRVSDDICNLWENKKHADVAFSVEGKVITAHKCILAERSEYFERMFSHEWNETKEGSSSVIEIKDTKHAIFEALIYYIYSDKVKFQEDEYQNVFDLMQLADFYCQVNIRDECEKILISNINMENAFFLVRNASPANASTLEGKVIKFIVDNKLLMDNLSPEGMIDLVGMDAFQKISIALLPEF
ncbi:RCC1 and BTB domain-containing protein 1-like [Folsomia candida]|uniref:RCC1 and BTB domain-containing protein 1-like n=1 Tax=Folsomia candida TaxID=158441 RepID=UPI001605358C|nr:RCC1 and BTB domain-containing protein 1-like [Folsomia candida]